MQYLTLFAVLSLVLVKDIFAATSCDSFTSEKTCMSGSAAGDKCSWCSSAAVGSTCFSQTDAKGLPSSVFTCKFQPAYGADAASCDSYTSQSTCIGGKAGADKCAWCNSAAVGSTCFTETDAKGLPSSIFQCEFPKIALKSTACDTITSQKSCMSATSGSEKCAWCNSAAVGGTCFIESDAHSLPSSVFQCDYQKAVLKSTTCDANTAEKACMSATSSSGVKCSWCSSAAVGATCFEETDAKGLPSSVFTCKFQSAYGATSCDSFTTEKSCMSGSANNDKCSWCSSAAVGSTCFSQTDAKGLPSSVFTCKFQATNVYLARLVEYMNSAKGALRGI